LDAAEKGAALFGYRGAQFPWEAAPIHGEEVTPVFAATGWAEQHIVPDIALAFWQYQLATSDRTFLTDATWPVLRAVAEWIESRGVHTQRGFEILNIMGPDEASNGLNNSAYVNLACRMVMKAAIRCAAALGIQPPASWQQIAATLYLPVSGAGFLTIAEDSSNDAFGDIGFLWPFDVDLNPGVLQRTWDAHRKMVPDVSEIAFAKAADAALTAAMGDRAEAARLFRGSWKPDWLEPFGMTREAAPQTHGCFLTNCGSLLRTAMFGFTGLRIGENEWNRYEATLPENWKSIEIPCIYVRGERKQLFAEHGKKSRLVSAE
jgi:trehalose/maltose hydrolase-like predicted phosphorylase